MIAESHDSLEEAEDSIGTRPTTPKPVVLYEANLERETPELMCVEVREFEEQNWSLGAKSIEQGCVHPIAFPDDLQVITTPLEISASEIKTGRIGNMVVASPVSVEASAYTVFDEFPRREIGIFECSCKLKEVDSLSMIGDSYGSIDFLGFFVFDPGKSNQFKRNWLSDCGRNSMEFLVNVIAHKVFVEIHSRTVMFTTHNSMEFLALKLPYDRGKCKMFSGDEDGSKFSIGDELVIVLSDVILVLFASGLILILSVVNIPMKVKIVEHRLQGDPGGHEWKKLILLRRKFSFYLVLLIFAGNCAQSSEAN